MNLACLEGGNPVSGSKVLSGGEMRHCQATQPVRPGSLALARRASVSNPGQNRGSDDPLGAIFDLLSLEKPKEVRDVLGDLLLSGV